MNTVVLIGRLTREPDTRYTGEQMAICRFSLAIDRPTGKTGEKKTDFIPVIVFGKQAENCDRYLVKGQKVAVQGRIQTGSYDKDGQKIYTTDVIADRVEFIEWGEKNDNEPKATIPKGFEVMEDDLPF